MTAFLSEVISVDDKTFIVEIMSLNHKYFSFHFKSEYQDLRLRYLLEKIVKTKLSRGSITINIRPMQDLDSNTFDVNSLDYYLSLQKKLDYDDDKFIKFISLPGVLKLPNMSRGLNENFTQVLVSEMSKLLDKFIEVRKREAVELKTSILSIISFLEDKINFIENKYLNIMKNYSTVFSDKIIELMGDYDLDEQRLYQEIVLYTNKMDITEEIVRFRNNLNLLLGLVNKDGMIGREINFLLQELNREVNTISNKMLDTEISQAVIGTKNAIDKIREQSMNIL